MLDDFILAKVTHKIVGNRFQVRTSKPDVELSWEVKGTRDDRSVQQNGAPVEVERQFKDRGTYQSPELYGKPASMGMNYDPTRPVVGENRFSRP